MVQYDAINIIQCTALSSLSQRSMLRTRDTVSPCGRGGLKICGICSVLYVCVSSCNLSPRSDYNRFVLLGLYRP